MDVVTTSLEALIQRATNPLNEKPDVAAIEAFCVMLGKESKGVHVASRLLATHIQSTGEKEALQALTLLDTCMKRCGRGFHTEIGKFRFLNVMIKLVSPKYLGSKTPAAVRQKILDLLYAWTKDYPREVKINETYEMLKKQGVVKEQASPVASIVDDVAKPAKPKNPIFEDEETTRVLQELLQSKDPLDLKLANKLIKSMVKDDEKRVQLNSQRNMELESVHNNVKLLSEMLDSYVPDKSSAEDVELMKELYDACDRLKPTVTRLANESQDNDDMLGEVLAANDELTQVFEKYASVILLSRRVNRVGPVANPNAPSSLLDLFSPADNPIDAPRSESNEKNSKNPSEKSKTDMEMLGDIFNSLGNSLDASSSVTDSGLLIPDTNIMQPVSVVPRIVKSVKDTTGETVKLDSKVKALEELNQLGESLLKESLSRNNSVVKSNFNNVSKPMKDIVTPDSCVTTSTNVVHSTTNSTFIVADSTQDYRSKNISEQLENGLVDQTTSKTTSNETGKVDLADFGDLLNDDDAMLDASPLSSQIVENRSNTSDNKNNFAGDIVSTSSSVADVEIKPLTDINVTIDSIKPGTIRPLTVIEEKNSISVVLHFPKGSPRDDVTVIVVTTMSNNPKALSNYLFQAVVPKNCKCRLQSPSGTELPPHNPFLPPSAITQIMLIANPQKNPLSLKFMLSYTMDDETFTEMGEVDSLPTA